MVPRHGPSPRARAAGARASDRALIQPRASLTVMAAISPVCRAGPMPAPPSGRRRVPQHLGAQAAPQAVGAGGGVAGAPLGGPQPRAGGAGAEALAEGEEARIRD